MTTNSTWLNAFPVLKALTDEPWPGVLARVQHLSLPAGVVAFNEGDVCRNYLLVLEGSVRVQKLSASGKEIVLYRVEAGQSCVLTTSCLLSGEHYHAEAVTETPVQAVAIPLSAFQQALTLPAFREFVFASYGQRITSLVTLIDAIAFGRMDDRLVHQLLEMADANGIVIATHQELARELGTAREVVSRLLKEFERHGWLTLERGRICVVAADALRERVMSSA